MNPRDDVYQNGYDDGFKKGYESVIEKMKSGEIPIENGKVWVCIPNENPFTPKMRAFFKVASPKALYAAIARISCEYNKRAVDELERKRDSGEEISWDSIMDIIKNVPGVGETMSSRIDSAVRKEFD